MLVVVLRGSLVARWERDLALAVGAVENAMMLVFLARP